MHNDVIADFADHLLSAGRSPATVRAYLGHLERLHHHHPDLLALDIRDLERFLATRRESHSAESRKAFRTAVRAFYRFAHRRHLIEVNPAEDLDPIRIPARLARIADDTSLVAALTRASARDKALILCGRLAGLRLTEIATLHTSHRHGERLRITGKGEKMREVPVHEELGWALNILEREQGAGYYFPGDRGRPHMHPQSINKAITRATGTNPHALRHAAATALYRSTGSDIIAVQQFLGHASVATTQRYLHIGFDRIAAGVAGAGLAPITQPGRLLLVDQPAISRQV